jgi:hypothetical protein
MQAVKLSKPTDHVRPCARAVRWANAALLRLAAWIVNIAGLSAPVERTVARLIHPFLNKMAMLISALIVIRAMALLPPPQRVRAGGPPSTESAHHMRRLFGARLRKLSKAGDPRARIAALASMLNNLNAHAARLARRLKSGLTRRVGGFKREPRALPLSSLTTIDAARADRS